MIRDTPLDGGSHSRSASTGTCSFSGRQCSRWSHFSAWAVTASAKQFIECWKRWLSSSAVELKGVVHPHWIPEKVGDVNGTCDSTVAAVSKPWCWKAPGLLLLTCSLRSAQLLLVCDEYLLRCGFRVSASAVRCNRVTKDAVCLLNRCASATSYGFVCPTTVYLTGLVGLSLL